MLRLAKSSKRKQIPADISITSDIAAAALAVVLLVFLGAAFYGFSNREKAERAALEIMYQRIRRLAFAGFRGATISAVLSSLAAWLGYISVTNAFSIVLFISFSFVLFAAVTMLEDQDS